ncbi:hypothetical protein [Bergeriella denitrificans]|uniref:Uncharacterized protein n=1 Tax=Bergeriella denitrificans TaxID=494 RepID=A0A378UE03_BERDE|nr:hypothetical protein [Bergeriella denitrificans]STZ75555.1 Uncharacterised protein [Bergeriella denitrificans]
MNIDYSLHKILESGKHTPSEIQGLLQEQGFKISLEKLTSHLNKMVGLGIASKHPDDTFTAQPH